MEIIDPDCLIYSLIKTKFKKQYSAKSIYHDHKSFLKNENQKTTSLSVITKSLETIAAHSAENTEILTKGSWYGNFVVTQSFCSVFPQSFQTSKLVEITVFHAPSSFEYTCPK